MGKGVCAAVLAGGKGSRFRPFTEIIAKPMMPVGSKEKPVLEYIISWLSKHHVRDITLLVGYHGYQIKNYFRDGSYWGVRLKYSWDGDGYSHTGGALLKAYKNMALCDGTIIVWYGDILATVNLEKLLGIHRKSGASATLVVADGYKLPVGVAEVDKNNNIVKLIEKPYYPLKVTIGILAIESNILEAAEGYLGRSFDIMGDLIPYLISKKHVVKAMVYDGFWYDVGSWERYAKLDHEMIDDLFDESNL